MLQVVIQWVVELSQFDIEYRPRTAIKVQALVDFIAEFTFLGRSYLTMVINLIVENSRSFAQS